MPGLFDEDYRDENESTLGIGGAAPAAPAAKPGGDNLLSQIGLLLSSTAAGARGDLDYVRRQQDSKTLLEQRRRKLELDEENQAIEHFKNIFAVGEKIDDDDARTKFLRAAVDASPALSKRYGEILKDENLKLNFGKTGEIVIERPFEEGEINGPDGKPFPAGTYKLTYDQKSFKPGQPMPIPRRIETGKAQEEGKSELGKIDQKDYTPESFKEYLKTKDRSALVPLEGKGPSVGTDREALALELGYKSFNDATPAVKKEINAEVKRREDERMDMAAQKEGRLAGQFAQNMSLQQQKEARLDEQQRRILPSQQKVLTGNRNAIKAIDDYAEGYEEFVKESKGATLSDIFRGTIAKNKNAQRASDLVTAEGRTPAEKKLAAKYNALVGNIRSLTDEVGVLTDMDAVRILGSFDPAQDRSQVRANLKERRKVHQRSFETAVEDYQAMGKDMSKFMTGVGPKDKPAAAAPTTRPRAVNPKTGEAVEWDGKAWVKVK